jgi:hypothetical protein
LFSFAYMDLSDFSAELTTIEAIGPTTGVSNS